MKPLLKSLAFILNKLPQTDWKPIPLCDVYYKYGVPIPNLVGHVSAPSVTTDATPSSITTSSAVFDTNSITSTGNENPSTRGICWVSGSGGTPTISDSKTTESGSFSTGNFSATATGLSAGTTYSVRAYATNSAGTGYGSTVEVTTLSNTAPTVALNSPADASSDSDTTPTLSFTGTDSQSDDIRYNVQVDTNSDFSGLFDSYSESNQSTLKVLDSGSRTQAGQSFHGVSGSLNSVKFYLNKLGSPTGNAVAKLYAHTGTFGTSSSPTGAVLSTSDNLDVSTLTTSFQLIELTFSSPYTMSSGTDYVIVIEYSSGTAFTHSLRVGYDSSSGTHEGNYWDSEFGSSSGSDLCFYLYSEPLLNKVSGTDSGFSGSPDNTDPFTSGQQVDFTVQAGDALAADTYYWRVRGIDPSGSNTYGAWSSTRSFEITSGSTAFNTFTENFADNSLDTAKWNSYAPGSATVAETGQQLVVTLVSGVNYAGVITDNYYDLTSDEVIVEVPTVGNTATNAQTYFKLAVDSNNNLEILQEAGTIYARRTVSGTPTTTASATYNATTHRWWRIREASGTTYWDYSSDGNNWSNFGSVSNPLTVTSMQLELGAGTYQAETSPGTAVFDNVNLPPDILVTQDISHSFTLDTTTITQNHIIATTDIEHGLTLDTTTIDVQYLVETQDIEHGLTIDATTITQNHIITPDDIAFSLTEDNGGITQNHILVTQDIEHGLTVDTTTITQNHVIATDDISFVLTIDNATITEQHILGPNDVDFVFTLDNVSLIQNHSPPTQDIDLAFTIDNSTITQNHVLGTDDIAFISTVDSPDVTETNFNLVTQDISHSFTLDNVGLVIDGDISPNDLSFALTTDNTTITQNHVIGTNDISFTLTEDNAVIVETVTITPQDISHPVTITGLANETNSPSTIVSDSSFGSNSWSNPSNVQSSDNTYATAQVDTGSGTYTEYLKLTNFGFSLPTDATIKGIEISIEAKADDYDSAQSNGSRIVKGGTIGSTNVDPINGDLPTSDVIWTYGDNSQLWGETWTYSDINSTGFGYAVYYGPDAPGPTTVSIDHIEATVYYKTSLVGLEINVPITPQDISHSFTEDNTTITQNHVLPVDDIAFSTQVDNGGLIIDFYIATDDITHIFTEDSTLITQNHVLTVQDISHTFTLDNTSIIENFTIVAQDISFAQTLDNTVVLSTTLTTDNISLAPTIDSTNLVQNHVIATDDIAFTTTVDNADIIQNYTLATADILFPNIQIYAYETVLDEAGNPVLDEAGNPIYDTNELVKIWQDHVLPTQDINFALTEDSTAITQNHVLDSQDINFVTSVDSAPIVQNHVLAPADITHSFTVDTSNLHVYYTLATDDITHALTLTNGGVVNTNHYLATPDVYFGPPKHDFFYDRNGDIYWVVDQYAGIVEKV